MMSIFLESNDGHLLLHYKQYQKSIKTVMPVLLKHTKRVLWLTLYDDRENCKSLRGDRLRI